MNGISHLVGNSVHRTAASVQPPGKQYGQMPNVPGGHVGAVVVVVVEAGTDVVVDEGDVVVDVEGGGPEVVVVAGAV